MALIEVAGLSKFYDGRAAIDKVSFKMNEGEIVGLLGLNGAGKSTILKILGCFLTPSTGQAVIDGFAVEDEPDRIRERIGYLPDTPPLYDDMTVEGYLRFVAELKNVKNTNEAVKSAIARCNLDAVSDQRLSELSHGFRQRVGIAQAIVHGPKIIILDEPINGLDPVQIVEMRDLILSLKGQHTIILSSHILSEMTKTCDRILIINDGRLVAEGTEEELQDQTVRTTRFKIEAKGSAKLIDLIRSCDGVVEARDLSEDSVVQIVGVECKADIRSHAAATVVGAGMALLSLQKNDDGLESIFMKLIQKSKTKGDTHA